MVWTEVSGLLVVVAALFVVVALIAIVFQETRSKAQVAHPPLPDNANLSDAVRRDAMRRFGNNTRDRKPTTDDR